MFGMPEAQTITWRTAALWSALLGMLFILIYGGTNWIASLRRNVGTLHFDWERCVPFVPHLIIPYMSIDCFFAAAPFLCTDRRELDVLRKRVLFAILVSTACFLVFPLRFAFARPPVTGFLGDVFGLLSAFDRPYNLLPSLHMSLLLILWMVYRAHTRGVMKAALGVWFVLIGASALLTYQHHVLDLVGGLCVAALAFHFFPKAATDHPRNVPVAVRYGLLALALAISARIVWPWTAILLWPAVTFALMAAAYCGADERVLRKEMGRVSKMSWLLLGPYIWGANLSFRYYRRRCPVYAEVAPAILIGRKVNEAESQDLIRRGVCAVLDLTAESSESSALLRLPYRNIPMLDLTLPTFTQCDEAVAFIREHRLCGAVYIHCALGYGRSACIAAAWLLADGAADSVDGATAMLRRARPGIVIDGQAAFMLQSFLTRERRRLMFRQAPSGSAQRTAEARTFDVLAMPEPSRLGHDQPLTVN